MPSSRAITALVGLAVGLAVSAGAWVYFETLALFLFLPFVPFLFTSRGGSRNQPLVHVCPECGFQTTEAEYEYCPRDGRQLRVRDD